mgnify:CR=1 FL=1
MSNLANEIREQDIVDHLINTGQEFAVDNWQGQGVYELEVLCDTCNGYGVLDASPDYTEPPIQCDDCQGDGFDYVKIVADCVEEFAMSFDEWDIRKERLERIVKLCR